MAAALFAAAGASPPTATDISATPELMGYHLLADVYHDFPQFRTAGVPYYNIGKEDAANPYDDKTKEDQVVNYFLNTNVGISTGLASRKVGQLVFTIPEKTASFTDWKAPLLYDGGNNSMGIVQDAGHFITPQLGCKNVLTFGSILDPARKPITQAPIYFDPSQNSVDIPLNMFGFDRNAIQSLHIQDLTAGTVKAAFDLSSGIVDAIARQPPREGEPLKSKPINDTKIENSGYFTSINEVGTIETNLLTETGTTPIDPNEKVRYYIGKTLGDVTLVASAMSNFGTTPNPYYGIAQPGYTANGTWKDWTSKVPTEAPTILALKTGDRLNWLRAILFNVPAIYETGGKVRTYKYFPGIASEANIRTAILRDFDSVIPNVTERYTKLANSLTDLRNKLVPQNRDNPTNFAPGGQKTIRKTTVLNEARTLLDQIIGRLVGGTGLPETGTVWPFTQSLDISLRNAFDRIQKGESINGGSGSDIETRFLNRIPEGSSLLPTLVNWLTTRRTQADGITENATLRKFYDETLEIANMCSPQSTEIEITKKNGDKYLSSKIVVVNVPNYIRDSSSSSSSSSNFELGGGAKRKGGQPAKASSMMEGDEEEDETVEEIVGKEVKQDTRFPKSFNTGILPSEPFEAEDTTARTKPKPQPVILENIVGFDDYFYLNDFANYVNQYLGATTIEEILQDVYDIYNYQNTNRILDDTLCEKLVSDFVDFCKNKQIEYQCVSVERNVSYSTPAVVLFNAYTCKVNAENASSFASFVDDSMPEGVSSAASSSNALPTAPKKTTETEASEDFRRYEKAFLRQTGKPSLSVVPGTPPRNVLKTLPQGASPATARGVKKRALEETSETTVKRSYSAPPGSSQSQMSVVDEEQSNLFSKIGNVISFGKGRRHTFRRKRPTSKKHVESTGTRSSGNARLRKQPRTRTTYRVRKHTGKSKTRRQRHNLDRV